MRAVVAAVLVAAVTAEEVVQEAEPGCTITAAACKNFPSYARAQFRDSLGERHLNTGGNEAACLKRAEDFHHWCGNGGKAGSLVAATYNPQKLSQVYHPGACEEGWSQWDAFCYKHYWEKKTWYEAEVLCRQRNSHLASVHSQPENRFIYALTRGLSAWIGYTDIDQDTHYQWSDNTQDDFSNFAKNCTGREHEPDCKPEERQQQWYDWEGGDAGTFVCKRNALLPVGLLANTTARHLATVSWASLLPALAADLAIGSLGAPAVAAPAAASLKTPELATGDASARSAAGASAAGAGAAEPRFVGRLPKGTLR